MTHKHLLVIAITCSKLMIAQNPYLDYKYGLHISNLSMLKLKEVTPLYALSPYALSIKTDDKIHDRFQLFHPTVSFDLTTKRKNTREFEVIDLVFNKENSKTYSYEVNGSTKSFTAKTTETAVSLRYQYVINYCKHKESKWIPSLGFSFNPYYQSTRSMITDSLSYHTGTQMLGIRASINPRLTYFFSKNLYMFAELSFTMLDISKTTFTNPARVLNSGQNDKQFLYNASGADRFEFRVGLGYKF